MARITSSGLMKHVNHFVVVNKSGGILRENGGRLYLEAPDAINMIEEGDEVRVFYLTDNRSRRFEYSC